MNRRTRRRSEAGFTLIELMVVLLIIGILAAIAIPTYLGARNNAENTRAQANLRTALSAMEVYYTENGGSFSGLSNGSNTPLTQIEPAVNWIFDYTGQSTAPNQIVWIGGNQQMTLGADAGNGTCWYMLDIASNQSGFVTTGYVPHAGVYYEQLPVGAAAGSACGIYWAGMAGQWHSKWP